MEFLTHDKKILIVGLGLIGGSYADALTAAGYEVGALEPRRSSLDYALEKGIIRHGRTEVAEDYVSSFDLVVFALYPHVFEAWIGDYGHCLRSGSIVTDVTGVKGGLVERIQEMLGDRLEFVPAHPMAGREVYGVENSGRNIFRGANFIITPLERSSREGMKTIETLALDMGFAKVRTLSPEEHDKVIAYTSQLPHALAVALINSDEENSSTGDFIGDSFRDLTRIAQINADLWQELFIGNRENLLEAIDCFADQLEKIRSAVDKKDEESLRAMFEKSSARRFALIKNERK